MATIRGTSGPDLLSGGPDDDLIIGGLGADFMVGGGGADIFRNTSLADSAYFTPDTIADYTPGVDKIAFTWASDPSLRFFIFANEGDSYLYVSGGGTEATSNTFFDNATIRGTDVLLPAGRGFIITGRDGNDVVHGGASGDDINTSLGDDIAHGEAGDDVINGSWGADRIVGGMGADLLYAGDPPTPFDRGVDVFAWTAAAESSLSSFDVIADFATGEDRLDMQALAATSRYVVATDGANSYVYVDENADGTSDLFVASAMLVNGGDILRAGANGVSFFGSANGDMFSGSDASDVLAGFGGADALTGGGGRDYLYGGAGADRFRYADASETPLTDYDYLFDFQSGVDRIDLSAAQPTGAFISMLGGNAFVYLDENFDNTVDGLIIVYQANVAYADIVLA